MLCCCGIVFVGGHPVLCCCGIVFVGGIPCCVVVA